MLTPILPHSDERGPSASNRLPGPRPLAFQEELGARESGQRASSITVSR